MWGRKGGGSRGTVWKLVRARKGWRQGKARQGKEGGREGQKGQQKSREDEVWGGVRRGAEDCKG